MLKFSGCAQCREARGEEGRRDEGRKGRRATSCGKEGKNENVPLCTRDAAARSAGS